MHIASTNIGKPVTFAWKGREVVTGLFKYPVNEPIRLEKEDVVKDHVVDRKYHGGTDKACYLYSANHYGYWKKLYPELEFGNGMFGENLTVEGLDESEINIGDVFAIGNALVRVTQPRQPCFKLEFRFGNSHIMKQFIESGFPGIYLHILEPGEVTTGDKMILKDKKDAPSVQHIFSMLYNTDFPKEEIVAAINTPGLAESCRRDLLKKWKT